MAQTVCAPSMAVKDGQTTGAEAAATAAHAGEAGGDGRGKTAGTAAEPVSPLPPARAPTPLRLVPGVRSHERAEADARADEDREQEGPHL